MFLEKAAVAAHQGAEEEKHDGGEQIAFQHGDGLPVRVAQGGGQRLRRQEASFLLRSAIEIGNC